MAQAPPARQAAWHASARNSKTGRTRTRASRRGAGMPNGRGPYGARRVAIRKASAAIHRREFVPRDTAAIRSNHHLWCMPRWQAIESPLLAVEAAAYEERELSRRAESAGARRRARTAVHARRSRKQTRCKLEQGRVGSWNRDQLGSWELQLGVGTRIRLGVDLSPVLPPTKTLLHPSAMISTVPPDKGARDG